MLKITKKAASVDGMIKDNIACKGFRLFFLGEHECDVEVTEVKQIDYDDVKRRLLACAGNSVFITMVTEGN